MTGIFHQRGRAQKGRPGQSLRTPGCGFGSVRAGTASSNRIRRLLTFSIFYPRCLASLHLGTSDHDQGEMLQRAVACVCGWR